MAFCTQCGTEVTEAFCTQCGQKISDEDVTDTVADDVNTQKGDIKNENFVIVGKELKSWWDRHLSLPSFILKEFSLQDGVVTITRCKGNPVSFKLGTYSLTYEDNPKSGVRVYILKNELGKMVLRFVKLTKVMTDEEYEKIEAVLEVKENTSSKVMRIVNTIMKLLT